MIRPVLTATVITILSVCSVYGFLLLKDWRKLRPPQKWRKIGKVVELYAYPLRSGRFLELEMATCTQFGFTIVENGDVFPLRDRSFIVYGETDLVGKSARNFPTMVLISISSINENRLAFQASDMDVLIIDVPSKSQDNIKKIRFQSWSDEYVQTIDCGDEAARWFSRYLLQKDLGLRLGYHDISSHRTLKSFKDRETINFYEYLTDSAFGLYADFSAVHLINEKSVNDLNEKLNKKVETKQFRPNIVVDDENLSPFAEDHWIWLKIGNTILKNVMDCQRCVLSTINPETGIKDTTREVLNTLTKYRVSPSRCKGPIMGVYLEVVQSGTINLYDEVSMGFVD